MKSLHRLNLLISSLAFVSVLQRDACRINKSSVWANNRFGWAFLKIRNRSLPLYVLLDIKGSWSCDFDRSKGRCPASLKSITMQIFPRVLFLLEGFYMYEHFWCVYGERVVGFPHSYSLVRTPSLKIRSFQLQYTMNILSQEWFLSISSVYLNERGLIKNQ